MDYDNWITKDLLDECRRRELIEEKKIIGGDEMKSLGVYGNGKVLCKTNR